MMKTCDCCRFWGNNTLNSHFTHKDCNCPKFFLGYRQPHERVELPEDEVQVENDEGWGFATGPKFGCIHHEEKTT